MNRDTIAFMTMMGGGRGGAMRPVDIKAQKELNSSAPEIPNLGRRVAGLFKPYTRSLVLIVVLVVISAALGIVPPLIIQRIFDDALFPEGAPANMTLLLQYVILMIAVFIVSGAMGIWQTYVTSKVGNSVMGQLRVSLFAHLQKMELAFFTKTKTGVIQSRLQNDVGGVAQVLTNTVSSIVGSTVTVVAAFVAMLILSWQLTVVSLILMPFLVFAQRRVGQVRARIAGQTQESLSEMSAITQESLSISGVLLSKTFSRQEAEVSRYSRENENQIKLQVKQAMSGQGFFTLVNVFISSLPAIIYLISGWIIVSGTGQAPQSLSAGTIVAFTTVQARLLFPLVGLMRVALDIQTSRALFARIFEYFDLEPAIVDSTEATLPKRVSAGEPVVTFEDVTFKYADASPEEPPTLNDLNFSVNQGEFVAFVGASGSGKTTVGSLIPRLYETTSGRVLYAGTDVRNLVGSELMSQIGVVSQESYLFHASIKDNLLYAKPDATQEELERAARSANIHETIVSFSRGYDTVVGERGHRLSGGEKQRIAIARVLLKNPPVLILDEATSALDTVSEQVVQKALDEARVGRTTIAIAHRLSTIVDADRIFVLDHGRIVESGTHQDLVDIDGAYARLTKEQRV